MRARARGGIRMIENFKRLERRLVRKAHIFEIYEDKLELPDGKIDYYDFLKHKGAAAVIPVLPDGRILLVSQFRNALDRVTLEIPAGGRNSMDEPFVDAAFRELEEETGYRTEELTHLISTRTAVAFCDEKVEVYIADRLIPTAQHLDEAEFIDVHPYTLDEIMQMIFDGKIEDSKTIASIMSYHAFLLKNGNNIE